jgi:hypothetical protein
MTARAQPVTLAALIPWGVESYAEPGVTYRPGDIAPLAAPRTVVLIASGRDGETVRLGRITRGTPGGDGYRLEIAVDPARRAGADLLATIALPGFAPYLLPRVARRQLVRASICAVETWRTSQLRWAGPIPPPPAVDLTPVPLPPWVGQWWANPRDAAPAAR